MSFTKSILYGEEMPLQIYILLFFTVMDMWTQDYVFAAILAYILDAVCTPTRISTAVQSQKAVSAYFTSKQILPFGFADQ